MRVISKSSSSYLKKPYKNFIRNNTFLSSIARVGSIISIVSVIFFLFIL